MSIKVNIEGLKKAKDLIQKYHYTKKSDWSKAQPSTERENDFIELHGYTDYGKWFLAIDTNEDDNTKARYKFPYGDFSRVHRSGLIAAKQRAGSEHYSEIEQAASQLLEDVPAE